MGGEKAYFDWTNTIISCMQITGKEDFKARVHEYNQSTYMNEVSVMGGNITIIVIPLVEHKLC